MFNHVLLLMCAATLLVGFQNCTRSQNLGASTSQIAPNVESGFASGVEPLPSPLSTKTHFANSGDCADGKPPYVIERDFNTSSGHNFYLVRMDCKGVEAIQIAAAEVSWQKEDAVFTYGGETYTLWSGTP